MKVTSTIKTGVRADGSQPFVDVGVNTFGPLTIQELAFIDALAEAKLLTIDEDDRIPPAPKSGPRLVESVKPPKKRTAKAPIAPVVVAPARPRKRVARRG